MSRTCTPIPKVAKERLTEAEKAAERVLCHAMARHICQRCGIRQSTHAHHILPRAHGGSDRHENLLAVCDYDPTGGCHAEIHAAPADAYREGWMRRRHPRPGDFHWNGEPE